MIYTEHTRCRVCKNDQLIEYLDLGMLPLSNNLAESAEDPIHNQKYPLKVLFCSQCGLSQLSIVIPPDVMFSHYVYRSSINKGYVDHCKKMAIELKKKHNLNENSFHIDIAGNDGALLQQFKDVLGHRVLNVDPAVNLGAICDEQGIPTLTTFWGMEAAKMIHRTFGKADLITATNVFAHVDNVREFIEAVKLILMPSGVLVLEFPYLIDFIDNREFDTVYFEHLSYFSIYPLTLLCEEIGLSVMSVQKEDIHGGSVRVTIGYGKQDDSVFNFVKNERLNYSDIEKYYQFAEDVQYSISRFSNFLNSHLNVAGFAASAKGNTLLNCTGHLAGTLKYIVDETPEKVGKFSPGTRIPIVPMNELLNNPPMYLVILSWNFKKEIMSKCRDAGYKGSFVIPIPTVEVIN